MILKINRRLKELSEELLGNYPFRVLNTFKIDSDTMTKHFLLRKNGFINKKYYNQGQHNELPWLLTVEIDGRQYYSSVGFYSVKIADNNAIRDRNENLSYELLFACDKFSLNDASIIYIELLERGEAGYEYVESMKFRNIIKTLDLSKPYDYIFIGDSLKYNVPQTKVTLTNETEVKWIYVSAFTNKEFKKLKDLDSNKIF